MKKLLVSILIMLDIIACNNKPHVKIIEKEITDSVKSVTIYQTNTLKKEPDDIAPDGSKIYLLNSLKGGGMCLCELPVGETTQAVRHQTVEEIWFFLSGEGEVWRKMKNKEEVIPVIKDMSITIPLGCHFQFKNTGKEPLRFIIVTMPPWPGVDEAEKVEGYWDDHVNL